MRILMRRGGRVARGLTVVVVLCGMGSAALGQAAATQPAPADSVAVPPELQAAVQADLARAEAAVPRSNADVAALAKEEMAAANVVSKLEQQLLGTSPEWQAASAKLEAANKSLDAIRSSQAAEQARQDQDAVARIQQQAAATLQAMATAREEAAAVAREVDAARVAFEQRFPNAHWTHSPDDQDPPTPLTPQEEAAQLQQQQQQASDDYERQQKQAQQDIDDYNRQREQDAAEQDRENQYWANYGRQQQ